EPAAMELGASVAVRARLGAPDGAPGDPAPASPIRPRSAAGEAGEACALGASPVCAVTGSVLEEPMPAAGIPSLVRGSWPATTSPWLEACPSVGATNDRAPGSLSATFDGAAPP